MKLETFAKLAAIVNQTEIERSVIAFQHKTVGMRDFGLEDIRSWFRSCISMP